MAYSGLIRFIRALDEADELLRIKIFADPVLEITEITDRVSKAGGKALLFENTGTHFPLLINAYGSAKRMSIVFGRKNTEETVNEIISLFSLFSNASGTWLKKLSSLPALIKVTGYMPVKTKRKGICQQIIIKDPDLSILLF
jgi:4-hydroxy-3-polyprenylbenzoate decarboxylase